ncbi:MAG: helix-turn-helix domain-containing protein [Actinomycetota bacterium]|nr:helix-turn-helix domain-containing protein [Actinomycetota bacterium]
MATAPPLILQAGDHARLLALVRSPSARPSLVQRARIVLLSAEGLTNTEIARRTGTTRPTVISWRNRYSAAGIRALGDLPRSGRPPVVDELEVVATTLADCGRPPAHLGASHWSSRLLGQQLGISFATVARIWRKWGIQPEHVETFTLGADLIHQTQARDLSGPYLSGPYLNFAAVRNLIDAIGSLTDGWQDHQETAGPTGPGASATESVTAGGNRQATSDTKDDPHRRSSRLGENSAQPDPDRSVGRLRDTKSVRAEFHGARRRRTVPTHRPVD